MESNATGKWGKKRQHKLRLEKPDLTKFEISEAYVQSFESAETK